MNKRRSTSLKQAHTIARISHCDFYCPRYGRFSGRICFHGTE
jgi:hypothetical protein